MGYDITFHPVSLEELQYYVFDVIADLSLMESRLERLTEDSEKRNRIRSLYQEWPEMIALVRAGHASFASNIAYPACVIAGFLHPYWYAADGCVTFLGEEERNVRINPLLKLIGKKPPALFKTMCVSLSRLGGGVFSDLKDESYGMIFGNYTASGYIANEKLPILKAALEDPKQKALVSRVMTEKCRRSLLSAIQYAQEHQLGLMEASDLYVEQKNLSFSDRSHLHL